MTPEEKKYYDKTYYKLLESLEWEQPERECEQNSVS